MSRIAELIQELCPNGVSYKKLESILKIRNGKDYKSLSHGEYPVYGSGGVMTHVDKYIYDKVSVLIPRKGSLGKIYYIDKPFWVVDTIFYTEIDENLINPKFLYHFLLKMKLETLNQAGGVPSLTQKVLNKIKVPVPPLEIQEEIVRILDRFTSLEAELEAELEARRKQYAFYRNSLLNFENGGQTDVYELQNVLTIKNGKDYKHLPNGSVPVYGSGGVMLSVSESIYGGPSVLIPRKGSLGNLFYVDQPFWVVDTIFYTVIDASLVLPKYVYYYLKTLDLASLNTAGGVPSLIQSVLKKIKIPVPTLKKQAEIVDVLDRFDELNNNISSGLPAEIAARRKQYEYYRDKLLTFKDLQPEVA